MKDSLIWLYSFGFAVSACAAWMLTPVVKRLALTYGWVDDPSLSRKIHGRPMPIVGGIAIISAFAVGLVCFGILQFFLPPELGSRISMPPSVVVAGALTMAAVGLYDDLNFLRFEHKFLMQIVAASIVVNAGYQIDSLPVPLTGYGLHLGWLGIPITMIWIVGVINAVNLLDGMDGLAAGTSFITFGSLTAVYAVIGDLELLTLVLVIAGALLGFLYHNFNPASIFMGDCGSLFLGFLLATYSLEGSSQATSFLAFVIPIVAMGLPVMDTALALVRRFLEQRPLFHPDRDHIHHRIGRRFDLGHRGTVISLYAVSIFFGIAAYLLAASDRFIQPLILVIAALGIYGLLRKLGYFRLRDLPWLIREREEFSKIRRFVESEAQLTDEIVFEVNEEEIEKWGETVEPTSGAAASGDGAPTPQPDIESKATDGV